MPYEIFISYSRKTSGICDRVLQILETRLGYEGSVFVDRERIAGGARWRQEIDIAIEQSQYLLVLATQEAAAQPENVREEVRKARECGTEIIPIEFDQGASRELVGEQDTQYIAAGRNKDSCMDLDRLEHDLRRALAHRAIRNLEQYREISMHWVRANLPSPSFWEGGWEGMFTNPGAVALVAPAGHGKSVIASHLVLRACDDPNLYPILLDADVVAQGVHALARSLGAQAGGDLAGQLDRLREKHGRRVMFLVDGLDQIRLAEDPDHSQVIDLLLHLSSSGAQRLVVTCRDDVWDATYRGRLTFTVEQVREIEAHRVESILRSHGIRPIMSGNPLLRTPFFLDLAIRKEHLWPSVPQSDISFFQRLFREIREEGGARPESMGRRKDEIVKAIAGLQVERLTYEIPRNDVRERSGLAAAAFQEALNHLKRDRIVMERVPSALIDIARTPTLRLTHDLLDCFSMADLVYRSTDQHAAAKDLCSRCEYESGWSVLSMLIRLAHHYEDQTLLRILFEEFLWIFDHKKFGDLIMARVWAATYVLRDELAILLPLVLEALDGRPIEALSPRRPEDGTRRASRIGDDPHLTPESASSVASAFLGLTAARITDAERVVPVLAAGLKKWSLKARFIDALSKYRTDDVREILVEFGDYVLDTREDLPCLRYVAQGLMGFDRDHSIIRLLQRIIADVDVDPVTRRRSHEALYYQDARPMPERTEEEIVHGLAITDESGRYSDWNVVSEYATYVHDQAAKGREFSAAICHALIDALGHTQTFVGLPSAKALGGFDAPVARDALLNQLTKEVLPTDVRDACLRALEHQLERSPDARSRQAFRFQLLHAARIAHHHDSTVTSRQLIGLALTRLHREEGWLVDAEALEVVAPWRLDRANVVEVGLDDGPLTDRVIERAVRSLGETQTGPDLEVKYRFASVDDHPDQPLRVRLVPTVWSDARRFTKAFRQDPGLMRHDEGGGWIRPVPLGDTILPGLAVVHGVVLTSDDRLILAQRSPRVAYAPLHWSASFEEQLCESDFQNGADPFTNATCRGFREEFGGEVAPGQISILSMVLQTDLLNLGIVMLLRPDLTASQIEASWRSGPQDGWEAQDLRSLHIGALAPLRTGDGHAFTPFHVTSRLRCLLLQRWIEQRGINTNGS